MSIQLANRVTRIKASATIKVATKAMELKASGKDVISLSSGEPDFDTPENIRLAAKKAIDAGATRYTAVDGTPQLKQAILTKLKRDNGLEYASENILVSNGGKHSLYNLFASILDAGDEVIIPAPYWVSYSDMVKLCDAEPVIVTTTQESQLKLTKQQLKQAITKNTKLLVLNSPSNPTGAVYSKSELQDLAEVLLDHPQILIATDDIYEHILWADEPFANIINACPELKDRTVIINGVAKAYAMTGWRIGFAAGAADLITAMRKLQSQSTSCPSSISQAAAAEAFAGDQSCLQPMLEAFKARHDYFIPALNEIPGFDCLPGNGAFYAFPNVTKAMAKCEIANDVDFAEFLLEEALVAGVPGSAFGMPGFIRFSYATDMQTLQQAISRLTKVLAGQGICDAVG